VAIVIGFPIVIDSERVAISRAWIETATVEVRRPGIGVRINGVEAKPRVALEGFPFARSFLTSIIDRGFEISINFTGDVSLDNVVGTNNSGLTVFTFHGPSATLALFIVSELFSELVQAEQARSVLLTGRCELNAFDGVARLMPLGSEGRVPEKCDGVQDADLWLHCEDFDQMATKSPNIKPFLAHRESADWLLEEFCETYGLLRKRPTSGTSQDEPIPNERTLFVAAIDPILLPDRDARLNRYFAKRSARTLLPLQRQVIADENKGLFPDSKSKSVRHAFITGPTGCGKTTLVQSLVLNTIHNRAGAALYVGPVKALVEEFYWNITSDEFVDLLSDDAVGRVHLSTSDYTDNDYLISKGDFRLACMVYEKASILMVGPDSKSFVDNLELVVIDEMHMLRDGNRGDVVDMLVTKVMRQNSERAKTAKQPIQIVMISTEGLASELEGLVGFKNPLCRGVPAKPVVMTESERKPPVDHVLYTVVDNKFKSSTLCTFDHQDKRRMSEAGLVDLLNAVCSGLDRQPPVQSAIAEALAQAGLGIDARNPDQGRTSVDILNLVNRLIRDEHRSIIVVCNSISRCDSLAEGFAKRYRVHALDVHRVPEDFKEAVNQIELERDNRQKYIGWASKGVFTHHSQMPPLLRRKVADRFRDPIGITTRPKVLFTTETLAYGVNLSASAIVLTDLRFTRTDPVNPAARPDDEELDPNQYHNLLGRAGRKSFENAWQGSAAYVRVPDEYLTKAGTPKRVQMLDFLRKYYSDGAADANVLTSSIAHLQDFHTMGEEGVALKKFSYSIFRTVLECVRSGGTEGIERREARAIFRTTLGYLTAGTTLRGELDRLFEVVFDKIAGYKSGDLTLFQTSGGADGRYSVQPTAEALLNTGISVHAVEPIAAWLQTIKAGGYALADPAIILLPALVVTPEFTQSANELLHVDQLDKLFETQQAMDQNTAKSRELAKQAASRLGVTEEVFAAIDEYLESPAAMSALAMFPHIMQRACFYLLLAGVMVWVRGGSAQEMGKSFAALFPQENVSHRRTWQPKHADRLEMLVRMTYNYFSQTASYLTESLRLALPKFTFRIKYGLPNRAMPYRNVFAPTEVTLPRPAILALNQEIDDPFTLLGSGRVRDVKEILESSGIDAAQITQKSVRGVVRRAYRRSLENFVNQLRDARTSRFLDAAYLALKEDGQDSVLFSSSWSPSRLQRLSGEHLGEKALACVSAEPAAGTLQLLPWHQVPRSGYKGITPCAFILVHALIARGVLTANEFSRDALQSPAERINVEWIAALSLTDIGDLNSATRLREHLLSFIEPELSS
jgi:energy-coupling factor transporter ATP-binding protein EcfA2